MSGPRSMGLGALADVIDPERVVGMPVGEVRSLAYDSRQVAPGTLFFAVPGIHVDGHDFAGAAIHAGAIGIVVERELPGVSVPQLVVDRTRRALADAADAWFGRPSERLEVIGITGTDGKTTTAFLAVELLRAGGRRPGLIGTVAVDVGDERRPNEDRNTTPEALELQELLADMVEAGNDCVVMEATSHGLALERTRNCRFDVGVVTSVTSEHLEFHGSLEAYRAAKARLVEEAPLAILNTDDQAYGYFRERVRDRVLTYGIETDADLRATEVVADAGGSRFTLGAPDWRGTVDLPMPGRFNVSNALAALAIAHAEGVALEIAAAALGTTAGVPGRMERVDAGQPFAVVVDYAHTADSLAKVLRMLRPVTRGRLIAVFGSAGERDPTKRPAMGRVGAELADVVIVTDEDPRLEDPRAINEAIADGARAAGAVDGESLLVIDDRREGIGHAISLARDGDVILLAGKGHETSIFYGTEKRPWDDRVVAREALSAAGWGNA
ncbi:MAG: UDP-N-acetylmuramoyl-L-alanyl-D-glutamate--2,6-diaminopimelate ligase [Chloroflexota bacterium]|nr:UDP-N-acetylmuramoyl-L-alanyl-D-glutamate--2,6-diaminopimelate ligase [Chloroflexota bacterium]